MKLPKDPIYWPGENKTILKKVICEIDGIILRTCPLCSKDFKPHNRLQKYCDSSCRNKANYKKHKRISRGELIEWIKKNRHEAIYGVHRENVVNMDTLLEFINQGEK